jgi:hypothetical protein
MRIGSILLLMLLVPTLATASERTAVVIRDGSIIATVSRGEQPSTDRGAAAVEIPLRVRNAAEGARGELIIRSTRSGLAWHAPLDAGALASLRQLILPPGTYDLELALAHHRRGYLAVDTASGATAVISVGPAPVIRGLVRSAITKGPLAGARVALAPLAKSIVTDAHGRFAAEVEAGWPNELLVSHHGHGTRRIELASAAANTTVPPIELARAAGVVIKIERRADKGLLDVELAVRDDLDTLHTRMRKRLEPGQSTATFDDLEAASYVAVVRGDEPLECIAAKAFVGAGDRRTISIALPVAFAHGRITRGGRPYAGAKVTLERADSGWQTTFIVPPDGKIDSAIWDPGAFDLSIRDGDFRAPFTGSIVVDGPMAVKTFAIDVPDRRLHGRVVDEHGAPVPSARVVLRSGSVETHPTIRAMTDDDGRFEYSAVYAGAQELRTTANGFLHARPLLFTVGEEEPDHEVQVVMPAGTLRSVEVVNAHGDALVSALVVCASAGEVRSLTYSDTRGRAMVATPPGENSTFYALPNEGSLAVKRVAAHSDPADPLRIVVPAGSSSLEIATLTTDGGAVPTVSLLVRYNGELIPPEVAREMHRYQGVPLATDSDGLATLDHIPPGVYELWPYRTDAEAGEIMSASLAAPINVNVATGPNKATVRFRRRN